MNVVPDERVAHDPLDVGVSKLRARHVDRDRDRVEARILPDANLAARLVETPGTDLADHAALFRDRNELLRADEAELAVVPAQERLESRDGVRGEFDLRLIVEREFVSTDRRSEFLFDLEGTIGLRAERGLVEDEPGTAQILGHVERRIGVFDEILDVVCVIRKQRDADAPRRGDRPIGDHHRLGDHGQDPLRQLLEFGRGFHLREDDRELVARQTKDADLPPILRIRDPSQTVLEPSGRASSTDRPRHRVRACR